MKLNKKGFTLVELLAVIVVLAIVVIVAIPNVMNAMNSAKKNAIVVEAKRVYNAALEKVTAAKMDSGTTSGCFSASDLGVQTGSKFTLSANVTTAGVYTIYVADDTWAIAQTNTNLKVENVTAKDATKDYGACGAAIS